jgi:hypothetical protein
MHATARTTSAAGLVSMSLALGAWAAGDAGPAVLDRSALDREMTELNGRIEQSAQTIPASGQLVVFSNGWDRTVQQFASGGRLMIGSKTYDHGLYCIAPSRIVVRLPSPGDTFEAVVGVDANQKNQGWRRPLPAFQGQVVFSVTVGGRPVFRSSELSRQSNGVPVRVDLDGAPEFTIEVVAPGSVRHIAWSDWAEAVVALADGRELPLAKMIAKQPDERWKRVDAVIEWGFQEGFENRAYDGRVEVTSDSGKAGVVEPLPGSTVATGAYSWRSPPLGTGRRGVLVPLLCTDAMRGPNRTIATVRTASGSFSFQPVDLAGGPILVPELGFFVADAATRTTASEFCAQLQAKGHQTIRQQVRRQPEQSWEEAMRALRGRDFRLPALDIQERKGWLPFHEPSMSVEIPDAHLSYLWRTGAWGITRYFKLIDRADVQKFGKDDKGIRSIENPEDPRAFYLLTGVWQPLAIEADRVILALDQMGMHRIARDCLALWLENQKADGRLTLGARGESKHEIGQLSIPWVMAEHYRLTGDKEWLKAQTPRLKAAADWIIARRRSTMKDTLTLEEQRQIKGGQRSPCGLQPTISCGDGGGRYFIWPDAYGYQSLRLLADVLTDADPRMGAELSAEAEQNLKVLKPVLEEAIVLSPVMRVRDGTCHRFLPQSFADRGPLSVVLPPGSDVYSHCGPYHCDYCATSTGIECFLRSGVMNIGDPFVDGHFDVLEDVFFFDHPWYYIRKPDYDPRRDWFRVGGWAYQSPWERVPEYYLAADDVPNYLRSWQNRCVADMYFQGDPFGDDSKTDYMFKEHTWFNVYDKQHNRGAFLSNFRNMLVMETGDALWLARATPRAWLEQGKKISVKNAPTHFGVVAYEIVSDVDNGKITATVEMPSRKAPKEVVLRFRHPKSAPIKAVTVNGKPWTEFNKDKETITLKGLTDQVTVTTQY